MPPWKYRETFRNARGRRARTVVGRLARQRPARAPREAGPGARLGSRGNLSRAASRRAANLARFCRVGGVRDAENATTCGGARDTAFASVSLEGDA